MAAAATDGASVASRRDCLQLIGHSPMHRIVIEPSEDGWLLRRPGGPIAWLDNRDWAERAAESFAHEFHAQSGLPACVLTADGTADRILVRYG